MRYSHSGFSGRPAQPGAFSRGLAAAVIAVGLSAGTAQAATITKVIDFTFNGSFINNVTTGLPQFTGSVQLTLDEGLNWTGPGSATAAGEITVDAFEMFVRYTADGPPVLVSNLASDIIRIQYAATDGAVRFLALHTWSGIASNSDDFSVRFRSATDIFTGTIITSAYNQSSQSCGSTGVALTGGSGIQACHGGSAIARDFVPAVVPIPAGGLLLLSALGTFGATRLRRRSAAA